MMYSKTLRSNALLRVLFIPVFASLLFASGCEDDNPNAVPDPDPLPPREPETLMIVGPHPDDAVLGCAGIIQQALVAGARVVVVVVTNGDGYPAAAALLSGKPAGSLTTTDYLNLAAVRQQEEIDAMTILGLPLEALHFLGYPDGGTQNVYLTDDNATYRHPQTGKHQTYGIVQTDYHTLTYGTGAPYRRSSAVNDIAELIATVEPDAIYCTSEHEATRDHRGTFWFVRDAVAATGFKGRFLTYLIRPDYAVTWPEPNEATPDQGFAPTALLPGDLLSPGIPWPPHVRVALTPQQVDIKHAAILAYPSQYAIPGMAEVLFPFVKNEEVFWHVDI